jgi:hypothetical protein
MDKDTINNIVAEFISSSKKSKKNMLEEWKSDDNQSLVFGTPKKVKKSFKTSYLFFCESERERLRNLDVPIIKRNEVHVIMSANWNILKETGGPEYDKFVVMAENYKSEHTDEPTTYEVTKPYHKFCLNTRVDLEKEFPDETAVDITSRLSDRWREFTKTQKGDWSI